MRFWGWLCIVAGLLLAANYIASGPWAFGGGWIAVIVGSLSGLLLAGYGLHLLLKSRKATRILGWFITVTSLLSVAAYFIVSGPRPYQPRWNDVVIGSLFGLFFTGCGIGFILESRKASLQDSVSTETESEADVEGGNDDPAAGA